MTVRQRIAPKSSSGRGGAAEPRTGRSRADIRTQANDPDVPTMASPPPAYDAFRHMPATQSRTAHAGTTIPGTTRTEDRTSHRSDSRTG